MDLLTSTSDYSASDESESATAPATTVQEKPLHPDDIPPFAATSAAQACIPIVIAAPHGGRAYTSDLLARMRSPDESTLRLEDRLIDLIARDVAGSTGAALLVANAPRALIDLNRSPDDVDWSMIRGSGAPARPTRGCNQRARSGLGLIPRRLSQVGELWREPLTARDLMRRVDLVHKPYHARLAAMLEELRDRWGTALLVDLHSMPPLARRKGEGLCAEFVLGDRYGTSCDPLLSQAVIQQCATIGRSILRNRPYAGGYILERHGARHRGIHALQLEVCRSIYLDRAMRETSPRAATVMKNIADMVTTLSRVLMECLDTQSGRTI